MRVDLFDLPDGCAARGSVIGAVLMMFVFSAVILIGALGGDLSAWIFGEAPRQPAAIGHGPGTSSIPGRATPRTGPIDNPIPRISKEYFATGNVDATVTGAFALQVSPPLDREKSYSDGDLTWIAYGKVNPTVLVSFGEDENSVAVSDGTNTALGVNDQCAFDVQVSGGTVAGHVECDQAQWLDGGEQMPGYTTIVIDFSATGAP